MPILDRERGWSGRTKSSSRGIANFQSGKKIREEKARTIKILAFNRCSFN